MLDHLPTESPIPLVKPPLTRFPPLWAQSRQEICESFEWFRSYQGGVYRNSGTVKGYFLSGFSAQRDCFEFGGKFIVSHGGGKAESTYSHNGHTLHKSADDQRAHDMSVRALIENYRTGQPLVLLIDDKYVHFPFDLGSRDVYMAVLGTRISVTSWTSTAYSRPSKSHPSGKVVRYKFAFQWCEDQGQPWWFEEDSKGASRRCPSYSNSQARRVSWGLPLKPTNIYFQCFACSDESPRVYAQDWACLNPMCPMFWVAPSGSPLPEQLNYNSEFISLIDSRPLPRSFRDSLIPKPPVLAPQGGVTTTYACSRGWHCQKCGRLSCRSAWEHYECPNCKVRLTPRQESTRCQRGYSTMETSPMQRGTAGHLSCPTTGNSRSPAGLLLTHAAPRGKIHLIQSNALVHIQADRIFEAYQQQAFDGTLLFRRWPLRSNPKVRGPLLTNYFSQNSGETYRYVGGADNTVPFDRAPGAVVQARGLIQKRIREALEEAYEFNEVLSAAYMQQQKMAFHSDSEKGLGPVVAGLSMGSPALMHFRLLSKHAPRDEQRTTAMTVVLRHGDVLVMEGAGVQEFYEYTCFKIPYNFRIAATARWITPDHS
ncbi:hypothetical protein GGX14DRAFT_358383 [Mycena pura]|uniref:Alpha-ketoglutarate-dependent dioxygenase AlkB-like domain-containing protein n=1 Tax=Mycena pura TaxID=153505 RepID=A0AAD6VQM9_9AGAR|nr:hypothetical protein GGX14DRAFT_358383 [Mycena pura]